MKNFHNIAIARYINGIQINVGCKSFVFNDIHEGMAEVANYLINPEKAIALWKGLHPDEFSEFTSGGIPIDIAPAPPVHYGLSACPRAEEAEVARPTLTSNAIAPQRRP